MSETRDDPTPPTDATPPSRAAPPIVTSAAPEADTRPAVPIQPSSYYAARLSGRHLGDTWQIVAAMAVVVGLLTGVVTLLDRFSASTPVSVPVVTPAPTTPAIKVDASSAVGAAELATFAEAHTGNLVDLDVSCFETVVSPACILEGSGIEVAPGAGEWLFLWVFTGAPCFAPQLGQAVETRDYMGCVGASLFWIDPRTDGSRVVLGNIQGAGTTAIKGPWDLESPAGGAIFPGSIHGYRLTPHLTRPTDGAAGAAASPVGGRVSGWQPPLRVAAIVSVRACSASPSSPAGRVVPTR